MTGEEMKREGKRLEQGRKALSLDLQETREKLRAVIKAGRTLLHFPHGEDAKDVFRMVLDDAEKFLAGAVVLIVPWFLLK